MPKESKKRKRSGKQGRRGDRILSIRRPQTETLEERRMLSVSPAATISRDTFLAGGIPGED